MSKLTKGTQEVQATISKPIPKDPKEVTPTISTRDLTVLLIKNQGIHEGRWVLSALLNFSTLNIGESKDGTDALPAGVVALSGVRLEQAAIPVPFSVDAAEVNPRKIVPK